MLPLRAMAARFELVRTEEGVVQGRIHTESRMGAGLGWDGRPSKPEEYLSNQRSVSWHGRYNGAACLVGISVLAQVPRERPYVTRVLEHDFDLTPQSEERVLLDALIAQDRCEVLWVNENVRVIDPYWPAQSAAFERNLAEADVLLAKRLSAKPKRRPRDIPYWAKHPGALEDLLEKSIWTDLPAGHRDADYWISDDWVPDVAWLAQRISLAFGDTGIWPLLWLFEEEPEAYFAGGSDPILADDVNVDPLLGREPEDEPPASRKPPPQARLMPFGRLPSNMQARLMLVPCQRPADVVLRIGGLAIQAASADITAVLREWERLYCAVLVAMQPSYAWLAIEAPPDGAEAVRAAREFLAFCPFEVMPAEATAERMASKSDGEPALWTVNRHLWPVGSYD